MYSTGLLVPFEGGDDLLGFVVIDAGIVVTLGDEEGRLDFIGEKDRGTGTEEIEIGFGIADPLVENLAAVSQ